MLKMQIIFPSKTPLLDRMGGSRPSEASVWRRGGGPSSFTSLRMTESLTVCNPPPRLVRFASLIGLGPPPVQEGSLLSELLLCLLQITKHAFLPVSPSSPPLLSRRGVFCLLLLQQIQDDRVLGCSLSLVPCPSSLVFKLSP